MAIDLAATKTKVQAKWGSLNAYAESRPFKYVTMIRFFNLGLGPITEHKATSKTQTVVAFLRADGLLVELPE